MPTTLRLPVPSKWLGIHGRGAVAALALGTVFRESRCGNCDSKMERSRKYSRVRGVCSGKRSSRASHMSSLITCAAEVGTPP